MSLRRIVSLLLVFAFILLLITGIVLYIVPAGRIAFWADWKFIGLSKEQWGNIHIISGILGLLAAFIHIIFNWKLIIHYLKNKKREFRFLNINFSIALVITVSVLIGTYFNLPPIRWIYDYGEKIKDSATEKYGEPPYGHAELSTIEQFCKTMQIDLRQAQTNLEAAGITYNDENEILKEVAKENNISPQALYLILKAGGGNELIEIPEKPPLGTGRKTIGMFCEQYQLDPKSLLDYLDKHQIKATKDMKLKDIAEQGRIGMLDLYNLLREYARQP